MARSPPLTRHLRRWVWRVPLVLGLVYALYVVVANLCLVGGLAERIANGQPERLQVHWTQARTWWPGRLTLRGLDAKGQIWRYAWEAHADEVRVRYALWPLLRREVRVPLIDVDGAVAGVRVMPRELAPPPPRPDGWVLRVERLTGASVRRVWFNEMQLEGDGNVEAALFKQFRGGALQIMPSRMRFRNARIRYGDDDVVSDAALDATVLVARHRREEAIGIDKLLKTDLVLSLAGKATGLDVVVAPDGKVTPRWVPGSGTVAVNLSWARGALEPGSRVRWHVPLGGHDVTGAARRDQLNVAVDVGEDIVVKATMPPLEAARLALDADFRVKGRTVPLHEPLSAIPRASGHVVADWHFQSLSWITGLFIHAPWLRLDGAGDVHADLRVADGKLAVGSRIQVPGVEGAADIMGNRVRGRVRADIAFNDAGDGALEPRVEAVMDRYRVATVAAPDALYLEGAGLRLWLNAERARLQVLKDTLQARVAFTDAAMPDLTLYNRFLPQKHLRFVRGAGRVNGDLHLDAAGDIAHGELRIVGRQAEMILAGLPTQGDIDVALQLRRADLKRHAFVVDGSRVQLRNTRFTDPGGEQHPGWWADVWMSRATMDIDHPIRASGEGNIAMKDAGFVLALFSRRKDYPTWIYKLIDAGQARAEARLQWDEDALVMDRVHASNDRFEVRARLRLHDQQPQGDLYARWHLLSVGVELRGGSRRFHLLRSKDWYDSRPDLLR